ncbi:MAG: metallophosphoesterase family protein [bacterium]
MKIIIISDIHSNLEAFEAVLKEVNQIKDVVIYSLGDIVGYGANPIDCIDLVQKNVTISLAGNHDYAAIGMTSIDNFNPYAKASTVWTANVLSDKDKKYLQELPISEKVAKITLVHASPTNPLIWEYITNIYDAKKNFLGFNNHLCFIGHSHRPAIFIKTTDEQYLVGKPDRRLDIKEEYKYFINVGSVGQPRDGIPLASYAVYDPEKNTVEIKRVPYDITVAQEKILEAGLPSYLAERLSYGK